MSNQQTLNCFICNAKIEAYRYAMRSTTEFVCAYCGSYGISDLMLRESSWIRPIMFYYLLHSTNETFPYFLQEEPADKGENERVRFVTKDTLINMQPKNINERIDMIMLNLGTKIKSWGDTYDFINFSGQDVPEFVAQVWLLLLCTSPFAEDKEYLSVQSEINETFNILIELGYLKKIDNDSYTFTADGWKRLGELQSERHERPQAFVAMWFSSEMDIARDSIKRAINDSGYIPIIIDEKEHNRQIVPEIFYEIQRSRFLIADLTGHRNGVYYEAGYAQGLGKEVILTCCESAFKERHFDVAQISTIVWTDADDLYMRLLRRIEATVGKRI